MINEIKKHVITNKPTDIPNTDFIELSKIDIEKILRENPEIAKMIVEANNKGGD